MGTDDQPAAEAVKAGADDAGAAEASRFFNALREKTLNFVAKGVREGHARRLAELEMRISQWPTGWGDDLVVLIYGDFSAPPAELAFPGLGITIEPEKVTNSIVSSAMCVLKARVKIPEKSVGALVGAAARINTLLGVLAVLDWGNSGIGWWSHVTHGSQGGAVSTLESDRVQKVVKALGVLPPAVARKVRSAMYWIREPRLLLMEGHRNDVLGVYAGYWNAFESLVEAVCLLCPKSRPSREATQARIDAFIAERNGKLDAAAIATCYRELVDPGFVAKASHALRVCFPAKADQYILECFRMKPKRDRLYDVRNAINHGDVDADDPSELLRIEDRHSRLWMIVFGMLGLLIPIDRPLDQQSPNCG